METYLILYGADNEITFVPDEFHNDAEDVEDYLFNGGSAEEL